MNCFLLFRTASPCHHHFTSFQRWEQLLLLFSCLFCVYGLGCKFDMTISYVETRNGLSIFWACFCIYDSPLCTYIFIDKVFFCLFLSLHRSQVLLNTAHTGSVLQFIVLFTWSQALQPSFEMRQAFCQGIVGISFSLTLVCHAKSFCFFVSILRSSYPTL